MTHGRIKRLSAFFVALLLIQASFIPAYADDTGFAADTEQSVNIDAEPGETSELAVADSADEAAGAEEDAALATSEAAAPAVTAAEIALLEDEGLIEADEIIVVMKTKADEEAVVETVSEATPGDDVVEDVIPLAKGEKAVAVETQSDIASAIEAYEAHPDVLYAQPNYRYSLAADISPQAPPNDPSYSNQWHMQSGKVMRLPEAYPLLTGTGRVRVAVLDTGIDMSHPDLTDISSGGNVNFSLGYDTPSGSGANFSDISDHGTHVAGIVAATSDNGIGVTGVSANRAEIIPIRIFTLDAQGRPTSTTTAVISGLNYAENKSCRIANMSIGGDGPPDTALQNKINSVTANGMLVIAAAGNSGDNIYQQPSDMNNVLSVVGTASGSNGAERASFSCYGPMKDIAAPGASIYSTLPSGSYGYKGGTSMATPYVSAVAAMLLSQDSSLTPAQLTEILTFTATDRGTAGRDDYFGHGVIDVKSAVIWTQARKSGLPDTTVNYVQPNPSNPTTDKIVFSSTDLADIPALSGLRVAVWGSENGQNDLVWYPATLQGGAFAVDIPITNHDELGTYNIHVYADKQGGGETLVAMKSVNVTRRADNPVLTPQLDAAGNNITLTLQGYYSQNVSKLDVAVWGTAGDQNDLRWYTMTKTPGVAGEYRVNIPISNHKEAGAYNFHAYAYRANGTSVFVTAAATNVPGPSSSVVIENVNPAAGTFSVRNTPGTGQQYSAVDVAVWSSANGQDDLRWYTVNNPGSSATVNINIVSHKYDYGTYNVHVYARKTNGIYGFAGSNTVNLQNPAAVSASLNGAVQTNAALSVASLPSLSVARTCVNYAVWGDANGQNDLRWYSVSGTSGNYATSIPISNHKEAGRYRVHAYVLLANGQSYFAGATAFTVNAPSSTVSLLNQNDAAGTFKVRSESSVSAASSAFDIAVWSDAGGQDDLKWYTVPAQSGAAELTVNISQHKLDYGRYNIHVYERKTNGVYGFAGATAVTMNNPSSVTTSVAGNEMTVNFSALNVSRPVAVTGVRFAVWGSKDGQNDLRWYDGVKSAGTNWTYSFTVSSHRYGGAVEDGAYNVHAYATLADGRSVFVGASAFALPSQYSSLISYTANDPSPGSYRVKVTPNQASVPSGVNSIRVAVWSNVNGQDDLRWYIATVSGADYYVIFNKANHKGNTGPYNIHVYCTGNNGVENIAGATAIAVS